MSEALKTKKCQLCLQDYIPRDKFNRVLTGDGFERSKTCGHPRCTELYQGANAATLDSRRKIRLDEMELNYHFWLFNCVIPAQSL